MQKYSATRLLCAQIHNVFWFLVKVHNFVESAKHKRAHLSCSGKIKWERGQVEAGVYPSRGGCKQAMGTEKGQEM